MLWTTFDSTPIKLQSMSFLIVDMLCHARWSPCPVNLVLPVSVPCTSCFSAIPHTVTVCMYY